MAQKKNKSNLESAIRNNIPPILRFKKLDVLFFLNIFEEI